MKYRCSLWQASGNRYQHSTKQQLVETFLLQKVSYCLTDCRVQVFSLHSTKQSIVYSCSEMKGVDGKVSGQQLNIIICLFLNETLFQQFRNNPFSCRNVHTLERNVNRENLLWIINRFSIVSYFLKEREITKIKKTGRLSICDNCGG